MKKRIFTFRRLLMLVLVSGAYSWQPLPAQSVNITPPSATGNGNFGYSVTVLPNGNFVVTDPNYDEGAVTDIGAVYLYNGATQSLISTLKGSSTNDQIGISGVTVLNNGNFIIRSLNWDNGNILNAGAITWGSSTTGVAGVVSTANSLVGSTTNDMLSNSITLLPNGNYVVNNYNWDNGSIADVGASTWGNGTTGVKGAITVANSLVGSIASDKVGIGGITVLTNGNYVIVSHSWNLGNATYAGAVTWANGTTGITGAVSAANSLIGSSLDQAGSGGVVPLSNGNYVVGSPQMNIYNYQGVYYISKGGAATWCNGTTGLTGTVNATNSLIGTNSFDNVGASIYALMNGNYVVASSSWSNNTGSNYFEDAGAVTWGNGSTGLVAAVSSANSLVGGINKDMVGGGGVAVLSNGNYVVRSLYWDNGSIADVGAATWGSGTAGVKGYITASNSLIGTTASDNVGNAISLTNGNYIVSTSGWNNGSILDAGSVTWANGATGITGTISTANSLIGTTANDNVGTSAVALANGNYAVISYNWDNGSILNTGAVTWGNGATGIKGVVSVANSLVGTTANDNVGNSVVALTNGNYIIISYNWDNGSVANVGAVTWANGATGVTGAVNASNSLVGSTASDQVGSGGITLLGSGNYVIRSSIWDNGTIANAGAITWADGTKSITGIVNAANSLVGSSTADQLGGGGISSITNNNYMINNNYWDNGSVLNSGSVTLSTANKGITGIISSCNSVLGGISNTSVATLRYAYNTLNNYLIVGRPNENMITVFSPTLQNVAQNNDQSNASITNNIALVPFINYSNCRILATVQPSGTNPVSGTIAANAYVSSTSSIFYGQAVVRRSYDITPATNVNTATSTITLYYTQSDFDDYNTNRGGNPILPTGPSDATGIANLKINQQHGTSATGAPGSYTGWTGSGPASIIIDPADANIIWNNSFARWEVTFNITGFSGFFAFSGTGIILPITWLDVTAALKEESKTQVNWKVQEQNIRSYTVERSRDGYQFMAIETVSSKGTGTNSYSVVDAAAFSTGNQQVYYRIQQKDADNKTSFSKMVSLALNGHNTLQVSIYPNPFQSAFTINSTGMQSCQIADNTGRIITTLQLAAGNNTVQSGKWATGTYFLKTESGNTYKLLKK